MLIQFELLLCLVCLLLQFCRFFVLLCHFFSNLFFFLLPFFFLLTGPRSIYARFLASLLFSFRFFSTSECFVLLLDTRTCSFFFLYVCCFDLFLLQTTCSLSLSLARSLSSTRCVSFPIWQFIGDLYSCKCYYCMFCLFPLLFYYMYMYIYLYIYVYVYMYMYIISILILLIQYLSFLFHFSSLSTKLTRASAHMCWVCVSVCVL